MNLLFLDERSSLSTMDAFRTSFWGFCCVEDAGWLAGWLAGEAGWLAGSRRVSLVWRSRMAQPAKQNLL